MPHRIGGPAVVLVDEDGAVDAVVVPEDRPLDPEEHPPTATSNNSEITIRGFVTRRPYDERRTLRRLSGMGERGNTGMWLVGFRDLQWRRRRFLIAVLSTALLFSVTLLLSGISGSFHNEVRRTMRELDVDAWIVPAGTTGPFTTSDLFPASAAPDGQGRRA